MAAPTVYLSRVLMCSECDEQPATHTVFTDDTYPAGEFVCQPCGEKLIAKQVASDLATQEELISGQRLDCYDGA